jgi:hypothetical protein
MAFLGQNEGYGLVGNEALVLTRTDVDGKAFMYDELIIPSP